MVGVLIIAELPRSADGAEILIQISVLAGTLTASPLNPPC